VTECGDVCQCAVLM